eukprot:CAMPEP_0171061418 /NCGR_PEP_ID=MMETSP0766_2-20121228/4421_1 /TAXON_ID=439317 /ORGANISM="Gambierdiscus australes, Strain CAWD 149" /LENGTH=292 /DNA_ID=CAMNT_0011517101 /DNA_START=159 /DNA_END=1035 /DNA_ORIENTATION=+
MAAHLLRCSELLNPAPGSTGATASVASQAVARSTEAGRRGGWGSRSPTGRTAGSCGGTADASVVRHEPRQEGRSLDEGVAELCGYHLLEEVVDVTRHQAQKVHPDVATYEELEEDQGKRELVALDGEAEEVQHRIRLPTAPIVEDGKDQGRAEHGEAGWPSEHQGDRVQEQNLCQEEEQVVARLFKDLVVLELEENDEKKYNWKRNWKLNVPKNKTDVNKRQICNLLMINGQFRVSSIGLRISSCTRTVTPKIVVNPMRVRSGKLLYHCSGVFSITLVLALLSTRGLDGLFH